MRASSSVFPSIVSNISLAQSSPDMRADVRVGVRADVRDDVHANVRAGMRAGVSRKYFKRRLNSEESFEFFSMCSIACLGVNEPRFVGSGGRSSNIFASVRCCCGSGNSGPWCCDWESLDA